MVILGLVHQRQPLLYERQPRFMLEGGSAAAFGQDTWDAVIRRAADRR